MKFPERQIMTKGGVYLSKRYFSLVWKSFLGSFPTSSPNFQLQAAIVKREAGNNCKGGKCDKKKKKKKRRNGTKKGNRRNSKNRPKKGRKKTRTGKKRPRSGKNNEKESKTRRRQRQKTTAKGGEGRQISGNATSCAMKAIKYARLFEGKATSIFRQVVFVTIDWYPLWSRLELH